VASLAALEQLRHDAPQVIEQCVAAAGLSLGEYTALVLAKVMDFETALAVVQERGRAMQDASDANPSGMVSVLGLEQDVVESLCESCRQDGEVLQVANLLCPKNIVVSGNNAACERIAQQAEEAGAMKVIPLAVAGAFHTSLMQSASDRLSAALASAPMAAPQLPVISNVDAQAHDSTEEIRQLLIRQLVSPVLWEASMRQLIEQGVEEFYEIGPGKVLRGLLRRMDRKIPCTNIPA
jgi:[acyl-carrier-protein] S-malonyltransferase